VLSYWALDEGKKPADFSAGVLAEELDLYPDDVAALLAFRGKALAFADAFQ
jgi:hypothetical protein